MRITEYEVTMESRRSYLEQREQSLEVNVREERGPVYGHEPWDRVEISPGGRKMGLWSGAVDAGAIGKELETHLSCEDRQRILILEAFMTRITGEEYRIRIPVLVRRGNSDLVTAKGPDTTEAASSLFARREVHFEFSESYRETESVEFRSTGVVRTADGQEIEFEVALFMDREYAEERSISVEASQVEFVDPLVVNYSGRAAAFSDGTFRFDLTMDGEKEELPRLEPGSGFLVLVDAEGRVSDGSQLFGPTTGDGFAELAEYDTTGNGWIDAGDPVFDDLRIWTRDGDGKDRLFALEEKGVGAIFLGSVGAEFTYTDRGNGPLGQNRSAGIFLGADGTAGTVQQVDFVV